IVPEELQKMHDNFVKACGGNLAVIPSELAEASDEGSIPKKKNRSKTRGHGFDKIREKHPNAFRPWSKEQDDELKDFFAGGQSIEKLAESFGRKTGAIRMRLVKLGL